MLANQFYNKLRQNICVDGVIFICGQDIRGIKHNKEPTVIKKTYFCVMVGRESGNAVNEWISKPGCRSMVNMECKN